MPVEIIYVIKTLPCIATTIKDGKTLYLLDDKNNLVFCTPDSIISLNLEYIQDCFNNNKKIEQDKFYITTSFKNDCINKEITLEKTGFYREGPDFTKNTDKFLANEVIINGEILTKYNLSDISLNRFENTRLFRESFDFQNNIQMDLYNKLNNNEKKRFACTLYYYYITGDLSFSINYLSTYLNSIRQNPDFNDYNENKEIQFYYKTNSNDINSSFRLLTDFKIVFDISDKKEEDKFKIVGGVRGLIGIILGSIALIVIIAAVIYYSIGANQIAPALKHH
jgi:hypothetical protein